MVLSPINCLLCLHPHLWPPGNFSGSHYSEEDKIQAWLQMGFQGTLATPKSGHLLHHHQIKRGPNDIGYGKSSPGSEVGIDLPFLPAMLLAKSSSVNHKMSHSSSWHSFLNRKVILYQMNDSNGLKLIEFTGLIMFSIILKQLAW